MLLATKFILSHQAEQIQAVQMTFCSLTIERLSSFSLLIHLSCVHICDLIRLTFIEIGVKPLNHVLHLLHKPPLDSLVMEANFIEIL